MTLSTAILLGLLQGFTEFLPISSSGHLFLAEAIFPTAMDPKSMLSFNVLLHAGSLLGLLLCYWKRWWNLLKGLLKGDRECMNVLWLLVLGTVPAAVVGFFFEDVIAEALSTPRVIGSTFLLTALLLAFSEQIHGHRTQGQATLKDLLLIGLAQACALLPGLSRSGTTMAAARALEFQREDSVDISFLLATPIIAGAAVVAGMHILTGEVSVPAMSITLTGVVVSALASIVAIQLLRKFVRRRSLRPFAAYLLVVGALTLGLGW